jgi:DNA-binding CsgD family transcriptional regulator
MIDTVMSWPDSFPAEHSSKRSLTRRRPTHSFRLPTGQLSPRELAAARCRAAGLTYKEIAAALGVSPNTVSAHLCKAAQKLSTHGVVEMIAKLQSSGLLTETNCRIAKRTMILCSDFSH